ncbi:MAG: YodL domain-containing protein [Acetatifactor muris]|nr:YodL domain-containing protein [Acetatifactor muris]
MTGGNSFIVCQMKQTPETRQVRFRSYRVLLEKGFRVRAEDYEKVYTGILFPDDTPENVRERLDKWLPASSTGHSLSVSDVLVFDQNGEVTCYYVEKTVLLLSRISSKKTPTRPAPQSRLIPLISI